MSDAPQATTQQEAAPSVLQDTPKFGDYRDSIPAKFLSNGEPNFEALTKSYLHLEGKMGALGAPVDDPAKYSLTLPEGVAEDGAKAITALADAFRERAHKASMTQSQFESVFEGILPVMPEVIEQAVAQKLESMKDQMRPSVEELAESLKAEWKTDDEFVKNVSLAKKAVQAYFPGVDVAEFERNPALAIKMAARVGAAMREDSPAGGNYATQSDEALVKEVGFNQRHPRYAEAMQARERIAAAKVAARGADPNRRIA